MLTRIVCSTSSRVQRVEPGGCAETRIGDHHVGRSKPGFDLGDGRAERSAIADVGDGRDG